jgi:RimJ/RimL family protein N-acetyltransferase
VTYRKTCAELIGSRVVVRRYAVTDAIHVWQAIAESRDSLLRWVPDVGRHGSLFEVRRAFGRLTKSRGRNRLVCGGWLQSSGRFLGEVGLYYVHVDTGVAELGYSLRDTARGSGYATEGVKLLVAHAIVELRLHSFEAFVGVENAASRRVAERLGMHVVGLVPADPVRDGHLGSVMLYRMGATDASRDKIAGSQLASPAVSSRALRSEHPSEPAGIDRAPTSG